MPAPTGECPVTTAAASTKATARREAWTDAVCAAIAVMRTAVTDPASPHRFTAATLLFDLEMTRVRHDREVCGTEGADDESPESDPGDLDALPPLDFLGHHLPDEFEL